MIIAILLLQTTCYAKAMSPTEDGKPSEETINVETLEKDQLVTLEKGKVYILSYPVVSNDWKISDIRVQVKSVGWIAIGEGEENSYLRVEKCEAEQGRVAFKLICKTECITAIRVSIRNEQNEEVQEYALKVTVKKSSAEQNDFSDCDNNWIIQIPVEPEVPNQPTEPSEPNEPENPNEPEKPEETEKPTEKKKIDTSGWVFEGVKAVYDGNEYVAVVTGLPDFVKAVYVNNTRTNAGSNTAYVTFEVPEEYEVPEGMETEIIIDKADIVIDDITLDKNWMMTNLVNGTINIHMPTAITPTEVSKGIVDCTYVVNGQDVGSGYTITDTGIYSVLAKFSLAKGMEENYNLTAGALNALYQVEPEMINRDNPKFNVLMNELQADNEGEKKISIWLDKKDDSFGINNAQWYLRYDPNVLEVKSYAKGPTSSSASQKEYDGSDNSGIGYSMIYTGGYYADNATLETIVFNVIDPDAKDIVVNITKVQASDMMSLNSTEYTDGYGIVLNQESNIIGVTLPNPQPVTKTSIAPEQEEASSDEMQTDDIIGEDVSEEPDDELTEEIEIEPVEEQDDEQAEDSVEVTEDDE